MRGLEEIKREDARRAKAARPRRRHRVHPTRAELIDLTQHLGIDAFDKVLRAIDRVIGDATSLALDDEADRAELIERLGCALGKVPQLPVRGPRLTRAERDRMARDIKDVQDSIGPSFRLPGKIGRR